MHNNITYFNYLLPGKSSRPKIYNFWGSHCSTLYEQTVEVLEQLTSGEEEQQKIHNIKARSFDSITFVEICRGE